MAQASTINDFNSQFLDQSQEDGAAGRLREQKRSPSASADAEPASPAGRAMTDKATEGESQSLRQRVMQARQAVNLKELAKEKMEEKAFAPAKQGTSFLLKSAWLNVIDSWGLTLIYVHIHVFLRLVLGDKLFCKLGREWLPPQIAQASPLIAEQAGAKVGLVEVAILLIIDLLIFCAVLINLCWIVLLISFFDASIWEKAAALLQALKSLDWGSISAISSIFSSFK